MSGTLAAFVIAMLVFGGQAVVPPPTQPARGTDAVKRIGDNLLDVAGIRVDTKQREITVTGTTNDVKALEFIATARGGFKAYESAIALDADAVSFNLALILIGLDRANARVPEMHFDPTPPKGDPVEIWVEWEADGKRIRVGAETLIQDEASKQTLLPKMWVYTGSTFVPQTNSYLAEADGALIGFVHTPSPVIEYAGPLLGKYGAVRLNPALKLAPGTRVTLGVRAVPRTGAK